MEQAILNRQEAEAAVKLENILKFVQRIDSGNTLAEMIFGQINREPSFLRALSLYPKEIYIGLCQERYNLNAS